MSSTIEVLSAVHGIAPRSDGLLKLAADVSRGRAQPENYYERLEDETAEWSALQEEAAIDIRENGKLRWQDHLRPIIKATEGFAPGIDEAPVTRWFETNTFYRKPLVTGKLQFHAGQFQEQHITFGHNISLIAPHTFAKLVNNRFDQLDIYANVRQLYQQLLSYFHDHGVYRVLFEVAAVKDPAAFIRKTPLHDVIAFARLFPHIQFGYVYDDTGVSVIPLETPENLGIPVPSNSLRHFRYIPPSYRPRVTGRELWQPIIDVSTTAEDTLEVSDWPLDILAAIRPAKLILTHTVELERLPLLYAQQKLKRLGEFTLELKNYIAEEGL